MVRAGLNCNHKRWPALFLHGRLSWCFPRRKFSTGPNVADFVLKEVAAVPEPRRLELVRAGPVLVAGGSTAFVAALGAANGGYFANSWSWGLLVCLWISAIVVALGSAPRIRGADLAVLLAIAALTVLAWCSTLWGSDTRALLDAQRTLLYAAVVVAALLVIRRAAVPQLLGGVLAGIFVVAGYSLLERLAPDRFGEFDPVAGYRLAGTIGYWNGLGIFAAIEILLALGFAARGRSLAVRGLAAASLVVLAPTLYFTFSRGASIALAIGILTAIALDPRRLQLIAAGLVLAPAPAVGVLIASRSDALTHRGSPLPAAVHEGQRLALMLALLAAASAVVAIGLGLAEPRIVPRRGHRLAFAGVVTAFAVGAVALTFVRFGGPVAIAHRAYDGFTAPPAATGENLNKRLFSFSGNGRADLWHAAWRDYVHHPWLGSGAGTYERWWLQHRPVALKVRDAHSLYLETLAELGPLGLLLIFVVIGVPLVAAVRARAHPLVPAAAGAFAAWAIHAAVDWDWELAAVTSAGLLCGIACVIAARREDEEARSLSGRTRLVALTAAVALAGVAFVGLVGNLAASESANAARDGNWHAAATQARQAIDWTPWSAQPWRLLGEARLGAGNVSAAERSFRKAIAKDPGDWNLYFDLARATTGRVQLAALAAAARLNPRSPEIAQLRRELAAQGPITVEAGK
jgi:O-Antigen ligase